MFYVTTLICIYWQHGQIFIISVFVVEYDKDAVTDKRALNLVFLFRTWSLNPEVIFYFPVVMLLVCLPGLILTAPYQCRCERSRSMHSTPRFKVFFLESAELDSVVFPSQVRTEPTGLRTRRRDVSRDQSFFFFFYRSKRKYLHT